MKLKHIIAVTVGAAALCAPSCDLDEKFYSEVTPDTFFTSPESTYAVLCRPFTHWKWYIGADRWYLQELTTDEMVCPKRGSDWYNSGEYYRLHYHTWSPDDRFVVNTYDGTTGGISRALEAKSDLQGVDYNAIGLNDAVKADHINQLNAITAYFYMRGLDYFGGMPIYYSVDDDLCARSTARETYAHIETLLKDAIPALSKKTTLGASEDGYIKQAAAAALLAQLYFNAVAYIGEEHFDECAEICRDIIGGVYGTYELDKTWYGPHCFDNNTSPEVIWTVPSETPKSSGTGISNISTIIHPTNISVSRPQATTVSCSRRRSIPRDATTRSGNWAIPTRNSTTRTCVKSPTVTWVAANTKACSSSATRPTPTTLPSSAWGRRSIAAR